MKVVSKDHGTRSPERLGVFCVQDKSRLLDDEVSIYKSVTLRSGLVSGTGDLFPTRVKVMFLWNPNEH